MKPQSRTLVLGSSCESIEILNESDLPWEPSNDDPTIGWRKFVRPWVVPQFGNVIMRRTFPTVFNFGSHCYIWMSSTSTKKKMHLDSKLFPRPRKQTWNQTLSSPGTKPRLGLNFLWFTGVSMEIPHMSIKSPQKWCTHQWGNKKSSWAIHTFQTFTFQEILLSARQNRSTKSPNEEGASVTG